MNVRRTVDGGGRDPDPATVPAVARDTPRPVVGVAVWRLPRRSVPAALLRVPRTARGLRRHPSCRFAKVLGTGDGRTFRARDADLRRWAVLVVADDADGVRSLLRSTTVRPWHDAASETWEVLAEPVASRGRWSGVEPFGTHSPARPLEGPVLAVTRARLKPSRAALFWRSVPPVSADLHAREGLRLALGVGEAPVGLQGTLSVWRDARALTDFAHRGAAHREAVAQTERLGWYAEELFARLRVLDSRGTVDGVDPCASDVPAAA